MPEVTDSIVTPYLKTPAEEETITVLLIDDQKIIGEAIKRMVEDVEGVTIHFCDDSTKALPTALSVKPTVILQDLLMPDIDGLTLVKFFRANPETKNIPIIVLSSREKAVTKADAFAAGANDYIVKLPDQIELLARIRYHSAAYQHLLQRNQAYAKLQESQSQLQADLDEASAYVETLLPTPLEGDIATSSIYIPSASLGGDSFGYHWIDDDHFALYLLDVCGHGVGAALLSITVMNVLRSQGMLNADFKQPAEVLNALNQAFPMEKHGDRFFTIWYGVYHAKERTLTYSSGGHPPALLCGKGKGALQLQTGGFIIGGDVNQVFVQESCQVEPGSLLYIYSDGIYELRQEEGSFYTLDEFVQYMNQANPKPSVEDLLHHARLISDQPSFADDFSAVKVAFR